MGIDVVGFVKKHGIKLARDIVEGSPVEASHFEFIKTVNYMQFCGGDWFWLNTEVNEWFLDYATGITERFSLAELKDVVDCINRVERMGGIQIVKDRLTKFGDNGSLHSNQLKRIIAAYTSVYGEP